MEKCVFSYFGIMSVVGVCLFVQKIVSVGLEDCMILVL